MRRRQVCRIPPLSRWILRAAAWIVPRHYRADWRREREREIWHGFTGMMLEGATVRRASWRAAAFTLALLVDAGSVRMDHLHETAAARALLRNPFACLAALLAALLALAVYTGGFRHSRAAWRPMYPGSQQLVLLSRPLGVLGLETAANSAQVWTWVESSKWFGDVAGFVLRGETLEVTPNFFSVLHAGRTPDFRFLGHPVTEVKFLDPEQRSMGYSGAIARLKRIGDRKAAEKHWGTFSIYDGSRVTATFLEERKRWPLYFAAGVSLLFLLMGLWRAGRAPRLLAFFTVKSLLLLCFVAAAWTEVATAIPIPITGGVNVGVAGPLVVLLLLGEVFVLRWSLEDQAERCPVCCRQVSMPVAVGSRSSIVLDRPGVEFLCTRGHGTLRLSDLTACTGEPKLWRPVSRSWQQFFEHEQTAGRPDTAAGGTKSDRPTSGSNNVGAN
ncbi:MAG: hypothetical protein C5B51_04635 [Terriglobia bacterium]|nr:MAG: hypothetical protein C5B51_04635 [Terriglobia bacterium]